MGSSDRLAARGTFAEDQPLREAWYDGGRTKCVFPRGTLAACDEANKVDTPYGGWDQEAFVGFGGIVASAATMLEPAERYYLQGGSPDIGKPLLTRTNGAHGGGFSGTSTLVMQRADGANVFIFFNKHINGQTANDFYNTVLKSGLIAQTSWPATGIGGFWIDPNRSTEEEHGSYNRPFAGLDEALDYLADGSRVNFKPGTSHWTGTISTKLEFRAPLGTATIGTMH